jgi:hypothetical protein
MRLGLAGEFAIRYAPPPGAPGWAGPLVLANGPTTEGADYLLGAGFRGAARPGSWHLGLIDEAGFTALAAADTHASHPGWAEFTGVSGSARPAWPVAAAAAGGQLAGSGPATVTLTASGSVRGAFLASQAAVGTGGGATIYATAAAAAARAVAAGGTLSITYTLRLVPRS